MNSGERCEIILTNRYYSRLIFKGPGAEGRGMGSRAASLAGPNHIDQA